MPLRWRLPSAVTPRADDLPLRLVGAWHLVCAVTGGATLLPALPLAVRHPVGWLTLALLAITALVGLSLIAGWRGALRTATVLQGSQVLAWSLPGLAAWIVRVGIQLTVAVPPPAGRSILGLQHDTTVFTLWGSGARLPLGVSVNLTALLAFVVCLTCLPDRGAELRADSA